MSTEPEFFINNNEPEREQPKKILPIWFWIVVLLSWGALNSGLGYLIDELTDLPDLMIAIIALTIYLIGFVPIIIQYSKSVKYTLKNYFN